VATLKRSIAANWCCKYKHMNKESIRELWRYRELLYFFAWRDVKLRYRQAGLGAAWALIQPLFTMIIFTLVFGRMAHMPSQGIPYPLFCYCALLPWTYFSSVLSISSASLVNNSQLIEKVYFPRVLLPAGSAVAGLLDFLVGSVLLVGMMFYYHMRPGWALLFIPLMILVMFLLTTGVSMAAAALNVRYRDVKHAVPFVIQIWLFATPVIYPVTMIPSRIRPLLALNPCWGMIDGFRACLFPRASVDLGLVGASIGSTLVVFLAGAYYFQKAERSFADII
jgi:lipopolysaccharide transport system permease protein